MTDSLCETCHNALRFVQTNYNVLSMFRVDTYDTECLCCTAIPPHIFSIDSAKSVTKCPFYKKVEA